MISTSVKPAGNNIEELCTLAAKIWHEHYDPMLPKGQVPYMIEKYQSPNAVKQQIKDGYNYFFLTANDVNVGYLGIQPQADKLFLSKIYIDKNYRRKGIATNAVKFVHDFAKEKNMKSIYLTVNKHNEGSIATYHSLGFKTIDSVVSDIGNGYVMDDYIMEKIL